MTCTEPEPKWPAQRSAAPCCSSGLGGVTLQQDNGPELKPKLCQNYLKKAKEDGKFGNTERPAKSPDLSPMELVWAELDRGVKAKQPTSATR